MTTQEFSRTTSVSHGSLKTTCAKSTPAQQHTTGTVSVQQFACITLILSCNDHRVLCFLQIPENSERALRGMIVPSSKMTGLAQIVHQMLITWFPLVVGLTLLFWRTESTASRNWRTHTGYCDHHGTQPPHRILCASMKPFTPLVTTTALFPLAVPLRNTLDRH